MLKLALKNIGLHKVESYKVKVTHSANTLGAGYTGPIVIRAVITLHHFQAQLDWGPWRPGLQWVTRGGEGHKPVPLEVVWRKPRSQETLALTPLFPPQEQDVSRGRDSLEPWSPDELLEHTSIPGFPTKPGAVREAAFANQTRPAPAKLTSVSWPDGGGVELASEQAVSPPGEGWRGGQREEEEGRKRKAGRNGKWVQGSLTQASLDSCRKGRWGMCYLLSWNQAFKTPAYISILISCRSLPCRTIYGSLQRPG